MLNNRKRRPTHPGEILREDVLPAAGLTQYKLARLLGVSRRAIGEILHGNVGLLPPIWRIGWRGPLARREMSLGLWQGVDLRDTDHARRTQSSFGSVDL